MNTAYLLLGGNKGNKRQNLSLAMERIITDIGVITKKSEIFVTAAWGNTDQPDFYNQALEINTTLTPQDLLTKLLKVEEELGRKRTEQKWQERTIDIDILFYDSAIINEEKLIIPHPFLQDRKFVLVPLSTIAGDFIHPVLHLSVNQLLAQCKDPLEVKALQTV